MVSRASLVFEKGFKTPKLTQFSRQENLDSKGKMNSARHSLAASLAIQYQVRIALEPRAFPA